MKVGDQVIDADGELWEVLDVPRIELAQTGLYRRVRSPQLQRYGRHMHAPCVLWPMSDDPADQAEEEAR